MSYEKRSNLNFSDLTQNEETTKESSAVPKPPGRNLDALNSSRRTKKVIPVDFDLKVCFLIYIFFKYKYACLFIKKNKWKK